MLTPAPQKSHKPLYRITVHLDALKLITVTLKRKHAGFQAKTLNHEALKTVFVDMLLFPKDNLNAAFKV